MKIINIKIICKTLLKVVAIVFFTQAAYAEVTVKLGTTGRLGMPIGDAKLNCIRYRWRSANDGSNWTYLCNEKQIDFTNWC